MTEQEINNKACRAVLDEIRDPYHGRGYDRQSACVLFKERWPELDDDTIELNIAEAEEKWNTIARDYEEEVNSEPVGGGTRGFVEEQAKLHEVPTWFVEACVARQRQRHGGYYL